VVYKKVLFGFALVSAVAAMFSLSGCNGGGGVAGGGYKITVIVAPLSSGKVLLDPNQQSYAAGTEVGITAEANPGYRFTGWTGTFTSPNSSVGVTMNSDITLTAHFTPDSTNPTPATYTVSYNINGGTGTTPAPQVVNAGDSVTLRSETWFSRSGYTFAGWNSDSSGTGTNYSAGSSFTPSGSVTLYARWTTHQPTDPGIEMVFVQGGTFTMGCTAEQGSDCWSDERPSHQVTLNSFSIGRYEVTQAQWVAVMGSNRSYFTGNLSRPVETVSWNEVQEFITVLNTITGRQYRLPTEAEWEYAARGGVNSGGYKYAGSNNINDVAWYWDNSSSGTQPVGTKASNELGIYDMSGNVWEWVNDWWGDYTSGAKTNPTGPTTGSYRVSRGGSWYYDARNCRVSNRHSDYPGFRNHDIGFRLALSSP